MRCAVKFALIGCIGLAAQLAMPRLAIAAEPARQFLDALLTQKYYDSALAYLDYLERTPALQTELRDALDYERAVVLIAWATDGSDFQEQLRRLDRAVELLERFSAANPDHRRHDEAQSRLRHVLFVRAVNERALATVTDDEATKSEHQQTALSLFEQAHQSYSERVTTALEEYRALREQPADRRDAVRYKALRDEIEFAMFMSARTKYEWAIALRDSSDDQQEKSTELLDQARTEFLDFASKFHSHLQGVWAIYYAGRCHQLQEAWDEALALYNELLAADRDQPALREVMTDATAAVIECWLAKEDAKKAVEIGDAWLTELEPRELESRSGLDFQWTFAQALTQAAERLQGTERQRVEARARKLATVVARHPGAHQQEARRLVAAHAGDSDSTGDNAEPVHPQSLQEAKLALQQVREELSSAELLISLLEPKLEVATGARREEIEAQLAEARQELQQQRARAHSLGRAVLAHSEPHTPPAELANARLFLAANAYHAQQYLEALVLADYVVRYQPSTPPARDLAKIALASLLELYNAADPSDRRFEIQQLLAVADRIVTTWPNTPEAEQAATLLAQLHAQQGDYDSAYAALERLPANSSGRGDGLALLGQRQWQDYLMAQQRRRAADGDSSEPEHADAAQVNSGEATSTQMASHTPMDDAQLNALRQRARESLEQAVKILGAAEPTETLVKTALLLSEIYIDSNEAGRAIELLEHPQYGPKTLADQNSPLAADSATADRTYRVALQAYIATLTSTTDKQAQLKKTMDVMDRLEKRAGSSSAGREHLAAVYRRIAVDLRQQMVNAPPSVAAELAGAFDTFLENLAGNTREFAVLYWIAETYSELGHELEKAAGQLTPTAQKSFERAAAMYDRILALSEEGHVELPDGGAAALKLRAASMSRRLGDYEQALQVFEQLLRENNMILTVQVEAAETLQAAGISSKNLDLLNQAIVGRGTEPNSQGALVWGWGQLSKICLAQMNRSEENRQRFAGTFYAARYNLVRCRYEQARLSAAGERDKYLQVVKRGISSLAGSFPDLGGPEWSEKFDRLYRQAQRELGEAVTGIPVPVDAGSRSSLPAQAGQGT